MSASTVANKFDIHDDGIYPWGGGSKPVQKGMHAKWG